MLRFLLLTLMLCLGCALVIGAAVAVGRTQPPSEAVRWFHMDDCEQPCFMGVTVGKTSYDKAKNDLAKVVAPSDYTLRTENFAAIASGYERHISLQLTSINTRTSDELAIAFMSKKGVISHLSFHQRGKSDFLLTVDDIVTAYGFPKCAYDIPPNADRRHYLSAYIMNNSRWIEFRVEYPLQQQYLHWDSKITTIWLDSDTASRKNPCEELNSRWQGLFATYPQFRFK